MKLRIRGNSLRLRLLKKEVRELAERGVVSESIEFGAGQTLTYSLEALAGIDRLCASFEGSRLRVFVPEATARAWADSDVISLVEEGGLKILVEKDFTCLNPRSVWQEDQSDNYANPHPSCGPTHA